MSYVFSFYVKEEYKKFFFWKRHRWARYSVPMSDAEFEAMGTDIDAPQWTMFFRGVAAGRKNPMEVSTIQMEHVPENSQCISTGNLEKGE